MKKALSVLVLLFCLVNITFAQGNFRIHNSKETDKIKFKLINNLIIIPVEINGVELSFLLDTGVSKPIVFNFLNITESLNVKNTEKIFLRGLGEGTAIQALKSKNNIFKIGDAINLNQDLYAVYDANLNLAPRLGVPVHGIIGYDLFKDFVVEINYFKKYIRLTSNNTYKSESCKKCETMTLEFHNNKPYLNAQATLNNKDINVKLLIDSGGSDALWLFEDKDLGIQPEGSFFNDFLGHGLSGSVYGKRSKVQAFKLKSFVLKEANVAFPDSASVMHAKQPKDRNGSLAGNILKRFNITINYNKSTIKFKKNSYFNESFNYNKSGIELEHDGVRLITKKDYDFIKDNITSGTEKSQARSRVIINTKYKLALRPAFTIVELRDDSPAKRAGLQLGDVIISVNNKSSDNYNLQDIMRMFYQESGKRINLRVERSGKFMSFHFYLESLFK